MRNFCVQKLPKQHSSTLHQWANARLSGQRILLGVASGCLLPTSHQPYETAAPLERSAPCCPSPSHKAHTPLQDATSAHSPTLAATGNPSAVTDFLFRDHRVEATSEKDSRVQGYPVPSVQTPSSRAFIDSPFCAGRPALRELPFAALAGVPWGVASPDTAAVWTTEDNHQPSNVSESKGRWGDHSQTEKHFDRNLAVGDVSAYSEEEQTRIYSGLDLSRIRAVEPLADPLSKIFIRRTSSFRARGEEALLPFIPGQESEKGDRSGIVADRQAEHWTTGWGQPDEGVWRQSVWGESDGGEERIDVRYVEGRKHKTCLVQEELALMGSSGVEATTEHACEVGPTYPWQAHRAEYRTRFRRWPTQMQNERNLQRVQITVTCCTLVQRACSRWTHGKVVVNWP